MSLFWLAVSLLATGLFGLVLGYWAAEKWTEWSDAVAAAERLSLIEERDKYKRDLEDLLFAARPLAEKTTWSFTGIGPYVRQQEVARNQSAENLRATIARITGATLRPESLEEMNLRPIDLAPDKYLGEDDG